MQLEAIILPVVEGLGYELWGIEYLTHDKRTVLRVYIESPTGVRVADCSIVTRQLGVVLDVEAPLQGRYNLEVSSPGIERPLFKLAHYAQSIGKSVRIRTRSPHAGCRKFTGRLQQVVDNDIVIVVDDAPMSFTFEDIEKANLA